MSWIKNILKGQERPQETAHRQLKERFNAFLTLLEKNNEVLKIMSDLEEKGQGDYLFDINYIRSQLQKIREDVNKIIDNMIILGGNKYVVLREKYQEINKEIERMLPGDHPIEKDDFTIDFEDLAKARAWSVGSKNAQLGEMKRMGLPVPDGFAISAWAYKHFMDRNKLQERITRRVSSLDLRSYSELERVSEEIVSIISESPVPGDLADAILDSYDKLVERTGRDRVALRSSAIGEDTLYSFAGQYRSYLNVGRDEIVDTYREVLAGKFAPKAIYYFMSHQMTESRLAMSVGCVSMIDSASAGVLYTRDPVHPTGGNMVINSVWGLGKYLVDGIINPDEFQVSRENFKVLETVTHRKRVKLVTGPEWGGVEEKVPEEEEKKPSITEEDACRLAELGMKIEKHYGVPQDIEWAIDTEGEMYFLQTRPLRVIDTPSACETPPDRELPVLAKGGITVCPGAGCGKVFHASSGEDLEDVPDGSVLVAHHPFPGLITTMERVSAIITEVGGVASHMATIAREYRIPTLAGLKGALELPAGETVTVDATCLEVYKGSHQEIVETRRPDYDLFEDMDIFSLLKDILTRISPLNLVHPDDDDFVPENCMTFHDITRFAHQKAMEDMYEGALSINDEEHVCLRLKTELPLRVNIIYIDRDVSDYRGKGCVEEEEIASRPMRIFWSGVANEGWPVKTKKPGGLALSTVMGKDTKRKEFSEESYAVLSSEYMLMNIRMGYHFSTIESFCKEEGHNNYIRIQYKEGGASMDRRMRRVGLISDVLKMLGFECDSKRDFLDATVSYQEAPEVEEKLQILGRLIMMTKQLDMALSNDAITDWYKSDIMKKLGLLKKGSEK